LDLKFLLLSEACLTFFFSSADLVGLPLDLAFEDIVFKIKEKDIIKMKVVKMEKVSCDKNCMLWKEKKERKCKPRGNI